MKKKIVCLFVTAGLAMSLFAACGSSNDVSTNISTDAGTNTDSSAERKGTEDSFDDSEFISVYSREDGSGTRGAFVELFGIEQKNEAGEKVDYTTVEAIITNSTDVMMTSVAGDTYGIGYISLGSFNDTVKAVKIDGVEASVETIKDGTYMVARPFNIAVLGEVNEVTQDFVNYILSAEGQSIIEEKGYIAVAGTESFVSNGAAGKVVIDGSSSVAPVMEKLVEAYLTVNTKAEIELQSSDSSTGMSKAAEGTIDIGMASRDLKESETAGGLTGITIAMDGIAVIVNHENPIKDLSSEAVKNIFMGEVYEWADIAE